MFFQRRLDTPKGTPKPAVPLPSELLLRWETFRFAWRVRAALTQSLTSQITGRGSLWPVLIFFQTAVNMP